MFNMFNTRARDWSHISMNMYSVVASGCTSGDNVPQDNTGIGMPISRRLFLSGSRRDRG